MRVEAHAGAGAAGAGAAGAGAVANFFLHIFCTFLKSIEPLQYDSTIHTAPSLLSRRRREEEEEEERGASCVGTGGGDLRRRE